MKTCPKCGLYSLNAAVRCYCRYDFSAAGPDVARTHFFESKSIAYASAVAGLIILFLANVFGAVIQVRRLGFLHHTAGITNDLAKK